MPPVELDATDGIAGRASSASALAALGPGLTAAVVEGEVALGSEEGGGARRERGVYGVYPTVTVSPLPSALAALAGGARLANGDEPADEAASG